MIGTMLALGLGCLVCRAHYGSDNHWNWYKETLQQYRERKQCVALVAV